MFKIYKTSVVNKRFKEKVMKLNAYHGNNVLVRYFKRSLNEFQQMSVSQCVSTNECRPMSVSQWMLANECQKMSVSQWVLANECQPMSVCQWVFANECWPMSVSQRVSANECLPMSVCQWVSANQCLRMSVGQWVSANECQPTSVGQRVSANECPPCVFANESLKMSVDLRALPIKDVSTLYFWILPWNDKLKEQVSSNFSNSGRQNLWIFSLLTERNECLILELNSLLISQCSRSAD